MIAGREAFWAAIGEDALAAYRALEASVGGERDRRSSDLDEEQERGHGRAGSGPGAARNDARN